MRGFLETAAGRLEYAKWGEATDGRLPILLLHEGLGSVGLWKKFPELLSASTGREVVAWSRHGHGQSDIAAIGHDVDYMHREADWLPQVHQQLGIERAHWLGHSDGGSIALIAAARHPELVDSLVLEAPHVLVEDLTASSIGKIAAGFHASDMGKRMEKYHAEPVTMFERWAKVWLMPEFREWNIEDVLPGISAPALLIQGLDDQYGTMDQLDRIERVLKETARLELPNCGHSPHHEQQEAVIRNITAFLEERQ